MRRIRGQRSSGRDTNERLPLGDAGRAFADEPVELFDGVCSGPRLGDVDEVYYSPTPPAEQQPVKGASGRPWVKGFYLFLALALVATNLIASRVVRDALAWLILANLFFISLFLFIKTGVWLLRKGFKKIFMLCLLPTLIPILYVGANAYAVTYDAIIDDALRARLPSQAALIFHTRKGTGSASSAFSESERLVSSGELWESHLSRAIIAIEDERYLTRYEGPIDARSNLRAIIVNLYHRRIVQGASTIPTQTAKLITGRYKTDSFLQKTSQWFIAFRLDQIYPAPEDLLAIYGNIVSLEDDKRGVAYVAASLFGATDLRQLSPAQSALIAGMLRNPNFYSPRLHPREARQRRDLVLGKMHELKMISDEEYVASLREEIYVMPKIKPQELFVRAAVSFHGI